MLDFEILYDMTSIKNLRRWVSNSVREIHTRGVYEISNTAYSGYKKLFHLAFQFAPAGTAIYQRDWDLLVVLDACRVDLMREVVNDFDFLNRIGEVLSVDSMTQPWMKVNFGEAYRSETKSTAYICSSPFSDLELDPEDFLTLDEIWRDNWNNDLGTVPPRPVTDCAIELGRSLNPEKMIVHYLQPHHPFITRPELDPGQSIGRFNEEPWDDIWTRLRHGEVSKDQVWEAYRENLEYVLDDVSLLLQNVDAERVVITSDHGNAFGEWGIYGHPMHMPLSCLRVVPWIETTATDKGTREPEPHAPQVEADVRNRLRDLGYRH